uniref:Uncharacterized protein n=3 Tax=Lactuca sativa TaxID=4236 RepID=A0A9R1X5R8_LACSA|nr:hypothetical protein LSAT_V11C600335260 [Lactuca sativa]KAJ0200652.1 hypothetical protein LSAT_V11C600335240 [Lactuca sativa]KAJ0202029.1 hypothetical protein LSAT_V11C600335190 [Lactuca sativa]
MSTIGFTSFGFPLKTRNQNLPPVASAYASPSPERIDSEENGCGVLKRRTSIVSRASLVSSSILGFPKEGLAIVKQGLLAGRIPGYLNLMNKSFLGRKCLFHCIKLQEGNEETTNRIKRTYRQPEKSGGHGVGWSPIIAYAF